MPLYENTNCPVCGELFKDGDDIVTCPECGTPHHRECYKSLNHCANQELHSSDFSFLKSKKEEAKKEEAPNSNNTQNDTFQQNNTTPVGEYYSPNGEADSNKPKAPFPFEITNEDTVYEKDSQKIGGQTVSDVASTVKVNIPRFINTFKYMEAKNKKTNWNWSGLLFGEFYLLFRKMYKQGVAFLCLSISTILLGWVAIAQLAPNAMSAMISVAQSAQSASNVMSATDMTSVINASDSNIMSIITYVVLGILLAIRIIIALFADNYYKTRVIQIIKDVDEKLKNGASFIQNPMMADSSDITNDQNLLKKLYLQRRGGVSLFPPIIAWLAIEMLLTII